MAPSQRMEAFMSTVVGISRHYSILGRLEYLCQKKGDLRLCSNYRTIALIPHANKILLRIIQGRLATYIEREISEEQACFRKGRGTRDQVANIRWILERAVEYGKTIVMCFIDYSKAFDCLDHSRLWNTLTHCGRVI
jgi:hypothetical protein